MACDDRCGRGDRTRSLLYDRWIGCDASAASDKVTTASRLNLCLLTRSIHSQRTAFTSF